MATAESSERWNSNGLPSADGRGGDRISEELVDLTVVLVVGREIGECDACEFVYCEYGPRAVVTVSQDGWERRFVVGGRAVTGDTFSHPLIEGGGSERRVFIVVVESYV